MSDIAIIQRKIYEVRGQKVILDRDLAALYQVETRVLNQSVKRNKERFPEDFMFQLTQEEWQDISSQIVISNGRGGSAQFSTIRITDEKTSRQASSPYRLRCKA